MAPSYAAAVPTKIRPFTTQCRDASQSSSFGIVAELACVVVAPRHGLVAHAHAAIVRWRHGTGRPNHPMPPPYQRLQTCRLGGYVSNRTVAVRLISLYPFNQPLRGYPKIKKAFPNTPLPLFCECLSLCCRYNPPKMKFDTKIWHPNISSQADAARSILGGSASGLRLGFIFVESRRPFPGDSMDLEDLKGMSQKFVTKPG